jgi:putative hemolysin
MKLSMARMTAGIAVVGLLLAGGPRITGWEPTQVAASTDEVAAATYCTQTGGVLEKRYPVYGTNGAGALRLSGSRMFCEYTSAMDGSRIHLTLSTLYTPQPTLAALAYYSMTPFTGGQGNPGSLYCTQLGGTDLFGGINAAGGGWEEQKTIDLTLEACIFPDMSTIDSFGLFYHSAGIVRGIDLSTVLKYSNPYANGTAIPAPGKSQAH